MRCIAAIPHEHTIEHVNDDDVLKALEEDLRQTHPDLAHALSERPTRAAKDSWLKRLEARAQQRWDRRKHHR